MEVIIRREWFRGGPRYASWPILLWLLFARFPIADSGAAMARTCGKFLVHRLLHAKNGLAGLTITSTACDVQLTPLLNQARLSNTTPLQQREYRVIDCGPPHPIESVRLIMERDAFDMGATQPRRLSDPLRMTERDDGIAISVHDDQQRRWP
jgi:hypothetical protein